MADMVDDEAPESRPANPRPAKKTKKGTMGDEYSSARRAIADFYNRLQEETKDLCLDLDLNRYQHTRKRHVPEIKERLWKSFAEDLRALEDEWWKRPEETGYNAWMKNFREKLKLTRKVIVLCRKCMVVFMDGSGLLCETPVSVPISMNPQTFRAFLEGINTSALAWHSIAKTFEATNTLRGDTPVPEIGQTSLWKVYREWTDLKRFTGSTFDPIPSYEFPKPQADRTHFNMYRGPAFPRYDLAVESMTRANWTSKHGGLIPLINMIAYGASDDYEEALFQLTWSAERMAEPKKKSQSMPVYVGEQGQGKSTIGAALATPIGREGATFVMRRHDAGESRFNGQLENRVLVIYEEVSKAVKAAHQDIKSMVTATTIQLEKKNKDSVTAEFYAGIMVITNYPQEIPLDESERRTNMFTVNMDVLFRLWYPDLPVDECKAKRQKWLQGIYNFFTSPEGAKLWASFLYAFHDSDMRMNTNCRLDSYTNRRWQAKRMYGCSLEYQFLTDMVKTGALYQYVNLGPGHDQWGWPPETAWVLWRPLYDEFKRLCEMKRSKIPSEEEFKTSMREICNGLLLEEAQSTRIRVSSIQQWQERFHASENETAGTTFQKRRQKRILEELAPRPGMNDPPANSIAAFMTRCPLLEILTPEGFPLIPSMVPIGDKYDSYSPGLTVSADPTISAMWRTANY